MTVSDGVTGGSGSGWSDRFEEGLHPSIERFNASIGFDITLLQQDLDGSVVHARMLGRCELISLQSSAGAHCPKAHMSQHETAPVSCNSALQQTAGVHGQLYETRSSTAVVR